MSKIVVAEFVSLDGYIADPKGSMDWFSEGPDDRMGEEMSQAQSEWDTLLMGRIAYRMIRGWAEVPVEQNPVARFMNEVPKVVFSKTLKAAPWGRWEPARVVADVEDEVREIRARRGKAAAVLGSGKLVQYMAVHGLVDEYLFWVYPVAFGRGKPWAPATGAPVRLKLVKAHGFKSGIVELRYRPKERR